MNPDTTRDLVDRSWDESIVPSLIEYIKIPNKSPAFDKDWAANGHMDRAVELIAAWCAEQPIEGLSLEVVRLEGRTPLIYMEVPGEVDDTVVLYGHLDKQPEMTGWDEGLEPWKPVLRGDKLYGRGGADDGYAAYASLTAIRALKEQGFPHARMVILIEGCEESGSYDLPHYVDALADRIGTPSLVICLDSGCGNYDQLWTTTSLRGLVAGDLRIDVLREGVHSGDASGVVASSFRVLRQLLSRIDDPETGAVLPAAFHCEIPEQRVAQAAVCGRVLDREVFAKFPWVDGMRPMSDDLTELVLNRTWRPALSVTGVDGMPPIASAGNVLRPFTTVKLSLRLPPLVDPTPATAALKELLESNPPYGARVRFTPEHGASGWNAPAVAPWLEKSVDEASRTYFGREAVYMGEGGTIPFMGMLGAKFPKAQFLITGLLGPGSNAHGPNEFLHIPMGKKLTACVAQVLRDHARR
ncbi:MAG: M20 family metallopeptidase [Planctomycetes bacterium]|nr:M20 family metallopeptidase [Planctomycetota bacterium]